MPIDDRGFDSTRKDPRSRLDRATIVVFFHESPTPSDWNPMLQRSSRRERKIGLHVAIRSRSHGLDVDEDKLSSCFHITCTGKNRLGHSPTQRKFQVLLRLNRGVDSPINFVTAPSITSLHVAPLTGASMAAWPPCHVAA